MASIYKRGKTWWISYYLNGKLIQRSLKVKDKKLANFLKKQKEIEIEQGKVKIPSQKTIKECFKEYKEWAKARKAPHTFETEIGQLNKFLLPIENGKVKDINTKSIQSFLLDLSKENKKPRTINHYLKAIRNFFNFAISQGYIHENPTKMIKRLKEPKEPPRFLSQEEIRKLLKESQKSHLYPMILTALYTGLRVKELMNLEWEDFDFENKTLIVRNKAGFKTKNRQFRVIPLPEAYMSKIKPFIKKKGPCFTYNGASFKELPKRAFKTILKRSGINNCGWHTLRKTFASHLIMQGVSITKVAKWLGHSSPTLTYQTYAHLAPQADKDIDRLNY